MSTEPRLHHRVRLTRPVGDAPAGSSGAIVLLGDGWYEVEVFDAHGETIDLFTLGSGDFELDETAARAPRGRAA